ncbi:MAG: nucleotidyltransferase domain-containing protein [Myxococcales bacterium]|nr:nucleotidyltransferase domain-containing protein [Myxococcales bacterium]MCB9737112.1 nucleotidyltransferase domain-containing protein [Deltaproteobacteria bacterium]
MDLDTKAQRYAAAYRARERSRRSALASRAAELRALLPEAAARLRRDFGASRVGIFGSLARDAFDEGSDVDIYVDHITGGAYFQAVDQLCRLLGEAVDLVELTRAPASLREHIEAEGEDVH